MTLDKSQLVKLYTKRLVKSLVPAEFGEEFIQSITSDLLVSIAKVSNSSSRSTSSITSELNQLTNQYRTQFISRGLQTEWVRFQTIIESLQSFKSVDQIYNYLIFFNTLKSQGTSFISPIRSTKTNIRNESLRSSPLQDNSNNKFFTSQSNPQNSNTMSLDKLINPYYQTLSEDTILKYLSYTLLGIDSKLLSFYNDDKHIQLPTSVNSSYSGLLFNVLECGLIYKNLINFIELKKGKLNSPIKVAYIRVMESYLLEYVKDINEIFNKNGNQRCSSLLDVYNALYDNWIYELRLLYSIVVDLDKVNGLDLLTKIFELTKFGDYKIQNLSLSILKEIIKPYNEILQAWLINGELIDSNNEFFIKFDLEKDEFNDIIQFLPARIPKFIHKNLGVKIYQIGKMIIFLTKYCNELQWINEYQNKYSRLIHDSSIIDKGIDNKIVLSLSTNDFQNLIKSQYQDLINYTTNVLFGSKNYLIENLINFKKTYFIENNDFIHQVILKGNDIFNNLSNNINVNYLSQILEESVSNSSMKNLKYKERLDFRLLNTQQGSNIGWEVFMIDYKFDDLSIHFLLDSKIMIGYYKMFNFLWKLRHLQVMLEENYIESSTLNKNELHNINYQYQRLRRNSDRNGVLTIRERKIIWIVKSFNSINLIRNRLLNHINVLINHLSYDVIENTFQAEIIEKVFKSNKFSQNKKENLLRSLNSKFIKNLDETNQTRVLHNDNKSNVNELTIDGILSIHENYLNQIINNKLLNENIIGKVTRKSYIKQIYEILDITFQFLTSCREFFNLLVNYVLLLKLEQQESEDNINIEEEEIDEDLLIVEESLQNIINRIYKQIYLRDYKTTINEFVQDLRTDHDLRDLSKLF
ncbi:spindle pole body component [Scheffersomyces amazonensis]|uniref:spindle pole body component n=1 Tax=Scheffersomyces amazonensis TaxID=1078765 RepID=UPI00315DD296